MKKDAKTILQELKKVLFGDEGQQFKEATLKDGTIIKYDGELAQGTALIAVTPEGEIPIPDGTYEMEDGTMVTTAAGLISEIVPPSKMNEDEAFSEKMKPYDERMGKMEESLKTLVDLATRQNESFEAVTKENKEMKEALGKQDEVNETILKGLEKFSKAPSGKAAEIKKNPLKKDDDAQDPLENQVETMMAVLESKND
jgi:hypothetical protein